MNEDLLFLIIGIIGGILASALALVGQRWANKHERKMIIRQKKFEKEYEMAEKFILDSSSILVTMDHMIDMVSVHFDFKQILKDKGSLSDEEMADFIGYFKVYAIADMKVEDVRKLLVDDPKGALQLFRESITKYYSAYVEAILDLLQYANKQTFRFYFPEGKLERDFEFIIESMREINRIYMQYTLPDADFEEVRQQMMQWCRGIESKLNDLIDELQKEIDEAVDPKFWSRQ